MNEKDFPKTEINDPMAKLYQGRAIMRPVFACDFWALAVIILEEVFPAVPWRSKIGREADKLMRDIGEATKL